MLLSIMLSNYSDAIGRYTDGNSAQFTDVIDGVLRELLAQNQFFYVQPSNDTFLVFLWFNQHDTLQSVVAYMHQLTQKVSNSFHNILRIETASVYSLPFSKFVQSREVYLQIQQLLETRFLGTLEKVSCTEDYLADENAVRTRLAQFEQNFLRERQSRSLVQLELCLNNFLSNLIKDRVVLSRQSFLDCCKRCAADFIPDTTQLSAALAQATGAQEAVATLLKFLEPCCLPAEQQDKKLAVKKALLLIQQNYMNEALSLEWLASQLWMNASYLSRLFSEEAGQSLTSYIGNYRIEQAKKLICESNLKLYEIAERTGFSSPIVFSTSFKKATGQTPSDYRGTVF